MPERFITVMNRVDVTIVSITSRSISVNDLPNCSQYQAGPPGPAGCPWAGSWSMKLTSYLSPNGKDVSLSLAIAARVAWPPSDTSVAIRCSSSLEPTLGAARRAARESLIIVARPFSVSAASRR